jgi:predicted dehydrogenase
LTISPIGIAVVGASGWGRNVVRAFFVAEGARLRWVCDRNPELLGEVASRFPGVHATTTFDQALADPGVDAVAVAVDAPNHFGLARMALLAGRHVFVEKPLALSVAEAEELCRLAEATRRTLMVGHLLLYHPAVLHIRAAIEGGELGDVLYLYAQRLNMGIVREAENAWWSLAPHDIAVAIYLAGQSPSSVSVTGASYLQRERGIEDIAFAALRFANGCMAHLHVSWLDPHKRRSLTVVGTRQMVTFDDTVATEKLRVYDKSALPRPGHATYSEGVGARAGTVVSPVLPNVEPLRCEAEHFVACVQTGARPRSDGRQGLEVVKVLEAGQRSMRAGGRPADVG